ncbi:nitrous oxide reductase family maturation protein NosD [Cytophagaceae bacterium ABcell3]|nr:nitrous oxide reductase family maturation protein NosD [Cytophagaceae bacterium ABcell3]
MVKNTAYFLFILLMLPAFSQAETIEVCASCPITTIQSAVDKASEYDTIVVKEGVYKENGIIVSKSLHIKGEGKAIIDAGNKEGIITVQETENLTIEGLTFRNVEISYIRDYAAIKLIRSKHCVLKDNLLENTFFGIYLEKSDSCLVENNYVTGNAKTESSSGNAIHIWNSNYNTIKDNTVEGHRDGIYLEFAKNSDIINNISRKNIRYGLHFMFSDDNLYQENSFIKNGAGVAVMYSKRITMTKNNFANNQGAASYGLLLKDITDSNISDNVFRNNTTGIFAEGTNRTEVRNNEISRNGWGVKMMGSCDELIITHNNFRANTFEVSANAKRPGSNSFTGNYWSSYTGYDLDKDGLGDIPHRPVKLFSYLLSRSPASVVLLRSMFTDLLELAEKITPVLTPEFITDEEPLMKPINLKQ